MYIILQFYGFVVLIGKYMNLFYRMTQQNPTNYACVHLCSTADKDPGQKLLTKA